MCHTVVSVISEPQTPNYQQIFFFSQLCTDSCMSILVTKMSCFDPRRVKLPLNWALNGLTLSLPLCCSVKTRCLPDICYLHTAATISVQTVTAGITSSVSANHAERQRCIGLNVAGWRQPSVSFICLQSLPFTLGWQAAPTLRQAWPQSASEHGLSAVSM